MTPYSVVNFQMIIWKTPFLLSCIRLSMWVKMGSHKHNYYVLGDGLTNLHISKLKNFRSQINVVDGFFLLFNIEPSVKIQVLVYQLTIPEIDGTSTNFHISTMKNRFNFFYLVKCCCPYTNNSCPCDLNGFSLFFYFVP